MPEHHEIVDGIRLPAKISGHPALDFCNTYAGWNGGLSGDYLESYDSLAVWARFAGLLPDERTEGLRRRARRHKTEASAALSRARELRSALYDVLTENRHKASFGHVAGFVGEAGAALELTRQKSEIALALAPETALEAPVLATAWAAGRLLTSPQLRQVRACPGSGCGWLFLDPHGRRRWCVMAICGNRAKVRRFAERHRSDAVTPRD